MDRKDQQIISHYNVVCPDRRLTKAKFKEYLQKRYKESLADRILRGVLPYFNNFNLNLELSIYCEGVENFAKQDI